MPMHPLSYGGNGGRLFTKPLQGSLFTKMRNYVMGNEERGYQVLPRSVLSKDNIANIRKQKTIGTWKHNSEAAKIMALDASSIDPPVKNVGTSRNKSYDTPTTTPTVSSVGDVTYCWHVSVRRANQRRRNPPHVLHAPPRTTRSAAERIVTIAHLFFRTVLTRH